MRIAEVIGRVTLSRGHPGLKGGRYVIVLPLTAASIRDDSAPRGEDVVAFDDLGASPGALIGLSEGAEAANPFRPEKRPIDAYNACLIDRLYL